MNKVTVSTKSTNTTMPAAMQNQRTPGKSTQDATQNAIRLVNDVRNTAEPAEASALGTRVSTGSDGSSALTNSTTTMASSTPTPTTMKTIIRLMSVSGTPSAQLRPKPAASASRIVTTAPTPSSARDPRALSASSRVRARAPRAGRAPSSPREPATAARPPSSTTMYTRIELIAAPMIGVDDCTLRATSSSSVRPAIPISRMPSASALFVIAMKRSSHASRSASAWSEAPKSGCGSFDTWRTR